MTLNHRYPFYALLIIAGALITGCGASPDDSEDKRVARAERIRIPVRTVIATGGTVVESLSVQGRLEVWRHEILSAPVAGIIREFPSLPDQIVEQGSVILKLDPPLNEAEEITKAKIKLERTTRALERLEYLKINAPVTVSANDIETARDAAGDSARELSILTDRAGKRTILAPFTGVFVKFQGVVGDSIAEGSKFAELLDISRYRIRLELPETSLRRLHLDQPVEVQALIDDTKAVGTVASIPASIDPEKGTGQVVIDTRMPPASWRPGGFSTARLVLQSTTGAVVLPREKVFYQENRAYCWTVEQQGENTLAKRTWVTTGGSDEKSILITKGVSAGDQVIVDGVAGLSDGVRILVEVPEKTKEATGAADIKKPDGDSPQ
jgi:RND family efflux transporter MFP subunit